MPSGSDTNFTFQNPTIPSSEPSSSATRTNETGLNSASPCHDCGWIAPALGPSEDPHPADALETRTIPSKTITRVAVTAVLNIVLLPLSISWPPQLVDMETMCALTRSRPSAPGPSIDPDGIRRVGMLGVLPAFALGCSTRLPSEHVNDRHSLGPRTRPPSAGSPRRPSGPPTSSVVASGPAGSRGNAGSFSSPLSFLDGALLCSRALYSRGPSSQRHFGTSATEGLSPMGMVGGSEKVLSSRRYAEAAADASWGVRGPNRFWLLAGDSTEKAQMVLAYLAMHPKQTHLRDKLATLLWDDAPAEQAR